MSTDWNSPILSRLPERGYQDNDAVQAMVSWIDEKLSSKAYQLQSFYQQLDPMLCDESALDYLAWCVGLSGRFWDTQWNSDIKRVFIRNAHPVLWGKRGTMETLAFVLKTHGLTHQIWTPGASVLPFKLSQTIGSNRLLFYVRLDVKYNRLGREFREAQRSVNNFAPAIVKHQVVYDYFRCGMSQLGEPMFSPGTFKAATI